eukprot:Platyproteum_vivax@DN16163_c0_g1_i1.p1
MYYDTIIARETSKTASARVEVATTADPVLVTFYNIDDNNEEQIDDYLTKFPTAEIEKEDRRHLFIFEAVAYFDAIEKKWLMTNPSDASEHEIFEHEQVKERVLQNRSKHWLFAALIIFAEHLEDPYDECNSEKPNLVFVNDLGSVLLTICNLGNDLRGDRFEMLANQLAYEQHWLMVSCPPAAVFLPSRSFVYNYK